MSDYEDMTNADVMSAEEIAEYDRDAEFRLDAADDERALLEAAEHAAAVGPDDVDDCGAYSPDTECGICRACIEARGDDIEAQHESGSITYEEAVDAHVLNGTWG